MKIGVSLPCLDHSAEELAGFVAAAEHAGLDAVWNYEVFKNPFVLHALAAHMTERIELCIGLAANAIRSPYEMANAAIDVAGIAHGRLVLGVGPGTAGLMDVYSGVGVDRPVARTREYLTVLKLAFEHLAAGTPASYEGTYQRFGTPTTMWGARADGRVSIPIYLGAVRPKMLQLAGEMCDGIVGYLLRPSYIEQVIRPNLVAGAVRAGRDPDALQIVSFTICSANEDREVAMRRARIQVGVYLTHPLNQMMAQEAGLDRELGEVLSNVEKHGPAALEHVTDDQLVSMFSLTGTPEECRRQAEQYDGPLTHICLHTPYIPPFTPEETKDAFMGIVKAFAREPEPATPVVPAR